MITLVLDASTYRGTVAVLEDDRVLVHDAVAMRGHDRERLMPAVAAALAASGGSFADVRRVVCGAGPGSFTSLRIAAAIAKGVAVGRSVPLYAVSSLALIVAGNVSDGPQPRRYLAVQDALRGECFVAGFEHREGQLQAVSALRLVAAGEVPALAAAEGARAVGPEQADQWMPEARGAALILRSITEPGAVDLAGWEPAYGRLAEAQVKWEASHGRPLAG